MDYSRIRRNEFLEEKQPEATREAVSWKMFLSELGMEISEPFKIFADNQRCIAIAKNPQHYARTKHIDIKYYYVREQIAKKSVVINYIPTELMTADVLTKPLARSRHHKLIQQFGIRTTDI